MHGGQSPIACGILILACSSSAAAELDVIAGYDLAQGSATEWVRRWQVDRIPPCYDMTPVETVVSDAPSDG